MGLGLYFEKLQKWKTLHILETYICKNLSKIVHYALIVIIINVVKRFAMYWFIQRHFSGAIYVLGTTLDPVGGKNDVECGRPHPCSEEAPSFVDKCLYPHMSIYTPTHINTREPTVGCPSTSTQHSPRWSTLHSSEPDSRIQKKMDISFWEQRNLFWKSPQPPSCRIFLALISARVHPGKRNGLPWLP